MQWHESFNRIPIFLNLLVSCHEKRIFVVIIIISYESILSNWCNIYRLLQWFNLLQMNILVLNMYYHNDNYIHFHHNTIYSYFFCKGHEPIFCVEFIPNNYTMTLWTQMKIFKIKMRCNNIFNSFYWLYKA